MGGAAVLLFVFSFLPYYAFNGVTVGNGWDSAPLLASVYLLGIAAGVLIVLDNAVRPTKDAPAKQLAGATLRQWGVPLAVASFWSALFFEFAGAGRGIDHAWGSYLSLLLALVLAGAAVAGPLVPALQAPLLPDAPRPQQFPGQQGQPAWGGGQQPNQPGGYGFPGGPQPQPQVGGQPGQPQQGWGGQQVATVPQPPMQEGGYGYPGGGNQVPTTPQPPMQEQAAPQPQAQPDPNFSPFWFAVPEPRPLQPEDGSPGAPVAQLQPGVWHLALEQRGAALLVEDQSDGKRRGLLTNTAGIQRG